MGIIKSALGSALFHYLTRIEWNARKIGCKIFNRNKDMRVSFSAILRISKGDKFLLVKSKHRNEQYGPLGGVFKFRESYRNDIDNMLFQSQGSEDDMSRDMRGHLPRKNLQDIIEWFREGNGRESYHDCLIREMNEEFNEVRLDIDIPTGIRFRTVRTPTEGPEKIPGRDYLQFRRFEVCDIISDSIGGTNFIDNIINASEENEGLLLATRREILERRARDKKSIGPHSAYLFRDRRAGPEPPPLTSS